MGNALQINRSRDYVRVEQISDESNLGEVYCIYKDAFISDIFS